MINGNDSNDSSRREILGQSALAIGAVAAGGPSLRAADEYWLRYFTASSNRRHRDGGQ